MVNPWAIAGNTEEGVAGFVQSSMHRSPWLVYAFSRIKIFGLSNTRSYIIFVWNILWSGSNAACHFLESCMTFQRLFFWLFFFAFPSCISGDHHFWVRFLRMWQLFNPTIQVVTFRLRGWCVLGVFLLPAFTRLGHERQDLLSPCDEMHVCTDYTSAYTLIQKSFWGNGVWTHVISKGKILSTGKIPQRRIEPVTLWTASPNTTNELFRPLFKDFWYSTKMLWLFKTLKPLFQMPWYFHFVATCMNLSLS